MATRPDDLPRLPIDSRAKRVAATADLAARNERANQWKPK